MMTYSSSVVTHQKTEVHKKPQVHDQLARGVACEQSQNKRKQQHKDREEEHTGGGLIIDCNTEEEQRYLTLAPITEQKQELYLIYDTCCTNLQDTREEQDWSQRQKRLLHEATCC
ncbi:hypothetical protein AMECASPLE_002056 [Ameca splendens]|uniref:Uncharacterized protein n=1 Tax=Ameca splendens TaxID=208324 RepID=A0ABV0Y9V9_9TELE